MGGFNQRACTHRNYSREDPKTKGVPGKAKEKRRGFVAGIFK